MSTQPARVYLSISEVLAELRPDFADISVSKIRFLETEGLIAIRELDIIMNYFNEGATIKAQK